MRERGAEFKQEQKARNGYDEKYAGEYHKGWENPSKPVTEFLEEYQDEFESGDKVLDLGCGQGRNILAMNEKGLDTHGIDISQEALKQAQQLLSEKGIKANLTQGSFFDLPYEDKSFKSVVSNASFHDIPQEGVESAFGEVSRVLEDEGLFLLYVKSSPKKDASGETVHHYTEDQLKELAEQNFLEITQLDEVVREDDDYQDGKKGMWKVVFRKKQLSNNL